MSINIFAQTGPAGVGSSTNNILWTRSEDLSALANGDRIATWSDNSGNSNDLTQSDDLYKPEYVINQQNGYPVVRFNLSNSRLIKNSFSDFPTSGITVFIVNKNNGESGDGLFSYNTSSQDNEFLLFGSNSLQILRHGTTSNSGESFNNNAWHITDVSWTSTGGGVELWKDNTSVHTTTLTDGVNIISGGCLAIAAEQDAVDGSYAVNQSHDGDFLEIIVYNIELNTAQRIIVSNYIAAKYALTISNDFYAYQSSFSYELAGIGRYDASNIHSSAQSADLITISNASAMATDGEYLLFAHDNASISSWSSTGAPANVQKTAREWRLDQTGDVGTIDVTLNEDNLAALPSGYTKYGIMLDSDGDYSSGARVYELAASGSDYKATGVDISDGDYMCIVAIKPTIEFSSISGSALESINASADIELNYIPAVAITVDYSTTDGSAVSASDYTAIAATTLTFSIGTRVQTVSVAITDDASDEGNEDFTINLSSPSVGINIGTNSTYTHTINDNDNTRKIYFASASSSGSESTTNVNITVEISSSDGSNATTVDYAVIGGTATGSGTDYTLASGTASVTSGNTTSTFSVSINNDLLDEDNETIILKLSNPSSNCNLSTTDPIEHTYTINDNDDVPTIYFTTTSSSGLESVSSKNIEVMLSTASSKDISVLFASSGTASSGIDYSINTSSPITILAGSTTKNILVTIIDDISDEVNETIILTLSGPTNATLGVNTQYTYTITDDDEVGYDGPGGVGKSANLKLWLKAEDIPGASNGDKISSWADQSGNGNDLTQSNNTFRPSYYKNIVNGFPVARFSDENARLIKNSFSDFPTSEISTFYVNNRVASTQYSTLSYATTNNNNEFLLFYGSSRIEIFRDNASANTGVSTTANGWDVVGSTWRNSDNEVTVALNSKEEYNSTLSNNNNINQGGCLALGAEQDAVDGGYDSDQDFEGDFSEVIIYNIILNTAQRTIVNNYLSIKYDVSMSSNNKYVKVNDAYYQEVIGIGTESDGIHNEAHGSGGIWLKQASNFGNGDYLLIGHNNVEPQIYAPDDDAGLTAVGIEQRWGRDWYFDVTDAGGAMSIDLTFDLTEAEMNSPSSPDGTTSNYKLLYRSGISGDWKIVSSASSKNPSQVIFSAQSLPDGDGYYTLGTINESNSPLPIDLISFELIVQKNEVLLKWRTATEINNDYFEVQHSINNDDWTILDIITGNGTTNEVHSYDFTHQKPYNGINYYRLKQTDFDGEFSFSNTITAYITNSKEIEVFPNPTDGIVNINNIEDGSILELIDINSRIINTDFRYNNNSVILDLKSLSGSIYYIRVISKDNVKVFKIIKN